MSDSLSDYAYFTGTIDTAYASRLLDYDLRLSNITTQILAMQATFHASNPSTNRHWPQVLLESIESLHDATRSLLDGLVQNIESTLFQETLRPNRILQHSADRDTVQDELRSLDAAMLELSARVHGLEEVKRYMEDEADNVAERPA